MSAIVDQQTPAKPARTVPALRFVARLWMGWLLFAAVEVIWLCHLQHGDARFRPRIMDAASAAGWRDAQWIAFEVTAAGAWAIAAGVMMVVVAGLVQIVRLQDPIASRLIAAVATLIIWSCLVVAVLSWGAFITNGTFLDRDSIYFSLQLTHPLRMLFWTSPVVISLLPIAALAISLAGRLSIRWLQRRMDSRWTKWFAAAGLPVLIGLLMFSVASDPPPKPQATDFSSNELLGNAQVSAQSLWRDRRYSLGPCAAALLDILDFGPINEGIPQPDKSIPVEYRPQISMKEYLQNVNLPAVKKWNVIFVEVESMRADSLRMLGAKRDIMPMTDSLASESLLFDHAYTQATHSNYAVGCPPSSQYPFRSMQLASYPANPPYPRVMIYDILKGLGYGVGLFSSGNEHWFSMNNFLQTPSVDAYQDAETWQGPTKIFADDTGFNHWATQTGHHGIVDDRFTVQSAMDWIDQQSHPFFVYLNFQASHFPYLVPDNFKRRFSSATPPDFDFSFGGYPRDKVPVVRGMYDDSLSYVDSQLNKLCQHLKDRGQWDNTVVVLTGDHGQAFYEHGFPAHANMLYNELVCVPLLIRVPGGSPRVVHDPVQHVDIAPMLLHVMGLPPHPGQQGQDELDPHHSAHHAVYIMVHTPLADQFGIVQDGYKLMFGIKENDYGLFNLNTDVDEKTNLLRQEPQRAVRMKNRLDTWRAAQLTYYSNGIFQKEFYAPVVTDP